MMITRVRRRSKRRNQAAVMIEVKPLMPSWVLAASFLVSVVGVVVNGQGVDVTIPPAIPPSAISTGGRGEEGVPIPPGYTLPPGTTWPPGFSLPPSDSSSGSTFPPGTTFPPILQDEISKQQELVELSMVCYDDPTFPRCDSCHVPSPRPKCFDKTCTKRICVELNQTKCCDVEWDIQCATLANAICVPEIYPW